MGLFFPIIGGIFSLGVIGLGIFTFFTTIMGFIVGGIMYFAYGKGDTSIWSAWWILVTGVLTALGLIAFIAQF
jgi:hypothetical protein